MKHEPLLHPCRKIILRAKFMEIFLRKKLRKFLRQIPKKFARMFLNFYMNLNSFLRRKLLASVLFDCIAKEFLNEKHPMRYSSNENQIFSTFYCNFLFL